MSDYRHPGDPRRTPALMTTNRILARRRRGGVATGRWRRSPEVAVALARPARGTLAVVVVQDKGGGQTLDVVELRPPPREAA